MSGGDTGANSRRHFIQRGTDNPADGLQMFQFRLGSNGHLSLLKTDRLGRRGLTALTAEPIRVLLCEFRPFFGQIVESKNG
jgi:hypothetical protein